jgi:hypothetical protein
MLIRMATLARAPNGDFICRKCIPADVREAYARQYRVSWEDRLRVPAGTPGRVATARCAEWSAEVDTRIAGLRAALRDEGQPLNKLNALALAGRWSSWFTARHDAGALARLKITLAGIDTTSRVRDCTLAALFLVSEGVKLTAEANELFVCAVRDTLPAAYDDLQKAWQVPTSNSSQPNEGLSCLELLRA